MKILLLLEFIFISKIFCIEPIDKKVKGKEKFISYFLNSTIETINDDNFDLVIKGGMTNDYLILFTVKKCEICNQLIKLLEDIEEIYSNENTNLTFKKLDVIESGWTSLRFNLERLPNLIYVSRGKYAIYPNENFTDLNVKNFIEEKNKIWIRFPKKVGYLYLIMKTFRLLSYMISQKYSFWDENYYWVLIIGFILVFIFVEYLIIKFCCRRSKKNKTFNHEHHHSYQKQENKKNKSKIQ